MQALDVKKLNELAGEEAIPLAEELFSFSRFLDRNFKIKLFLENDSIEKDQRKQLFGELRPESTGIFRRLVSFLIDQGLMLRLSRLAQKYVELIVKEKGLKFAVLEAAFPLDNQQLAGIKEYFGLDLIMIAEVNPKLVGGFIIRFTDGRIYDASLSGRLAQLRTEMVR